MAYIDDVGFGNRLENLATEVTNLAYQLEAKLQQLREAAEQAYAANGSSEAAMDTAYNKTDGWAADIRSLGAVYVSYLDFVDNGTVSSLDRRTDLNKFK